MQAGTSGELLPSLQSQGERSGGTSRTLDIAFLHNKKGGWGSGQDSAQEFGVCLQPVPISGMARGRVIKPRTTTSTS